MGIGGLSWHNLIGVTSSTMVVGLPIYLAAGLAVRLQVDLGFGAARLGGMVSVYYLSAAIISWAWGLALDRIGAARVMRYCTLGTSVCLFWVGVLADSYADLLLVAVLAGICNAGVQLGTNQFVSRRVAYGSQGVVFGLKQAAIPMATLVGGLSVPVIAVHHGWRPVFIVACVFSAVVAIFFVPRPLLGRQAYRLQFPATPIPRSQRRPLVWLAVGAGIGVSAACGMSAFLVTGMVGVGYTESRAGLLLAVGGLASVTSRIVIGWWTDRHAGRGFRLVVVMLVVGSVGYLALAVFESGPQVVHVLATVMGFAAGWGWGGALNHLVVQRFRAQPARATGIVQVGLQAGGVLGPALFGAAYQWRGNTAAWMLMFVLAAGAAGVVLWASRKLAASIAEQ